MTSCKKVFSRRSYKQSDSHLCQPLRLLILLISLGLMLMLLPYPTEAARVTDGIIAIVNKTVLTKSELQETIQTEQDEIRKTFQGAERDRRLRQLKFKGLTRLIERTLQIQIARERGHEVTDAEMNLAMQEFQRQGDTFDSSNPQVVKNLKQQLTILKVIEREIKAGIMVSESEMKEFYNSQPSRFKLPDEYSVSQILIRPRTHEQPEDTQHRAEAVYQALQDGADFSDIAERHSDGSEAIRGGDLGLMRQGEMEPLLDEALSQLDPGDITAPIETNHGFHILRLNERQPPVIRPYDEVKRDVQALLAQQKSEDMYHRWIYELQNKAHIEVKF